MQSVHFGPHALDDLRSTLESAGARTALVLTGPSRRHLEALQAALPSVRLEVFDGAKVHVPVEVVEAAVTHLQSVQPDALIALGGGAAVGLGKALRTKAETPLYAVPTTFSGSERTSIWGTTSGREKKTARNPKVQPAGVYYRPDFVAGMPRAQLVKSLMNALAHPVSALSTGSLDDDGQTTALQAITALCDALFQLAQSPTDSGGLERGLRGSALAGEVLERGQLGVHHKMAHFIGGHFASEHAAVHALLLPHSIHTIQTTQPELYGALQRAAGVSDPAAQLYDLLVRVGAQSSLRSLDIPPSAVDEAIAQRPGLPQEILRAAATGRRPSKHTWTEDWGLREPVARWGEKLGEAKTVVVAIPGRQQSAEGILLRLRETIGDGPGVSAVAPHAPGAVWYTNSYRDSAATIGPSLEQGLDELRAVVKRTREAAPAARLIIFGFSQGACLGLELLARLEDIRVDGAVTVAGARIGPSAAYAAPLARRDGVPVLLGVAANDSWVDQADVEATAASFASVGADVETIVEGGDDHHISARQRIRARALIHGATPSALRGFGGHETEALPGALPLRQNSPRRAAYGLYAEQINATGFVADRESNRRTWTYRVRPTAQHGRLEPLGGSLVTPDFEGGFDPNLVGFYPLPIPATPTDFIDGLVTLGGAGRPELRRGYAIHLYVANRSMNDRAFYNADGEMLVVPQLGGLTLQTELGVIDVDPGEVAILPRGLRTSVLLKVPEARGYVAEVYGRSFELPDRGPVGANGLTEERHFRTPAAQYEDRLSPGYRIVAKNGGRLYQVTQDHSPHDVVAWHGNLAPRVYDLLDFSPVSNVRFDHVDPSVYTVLSAALDERGAHTIDFVYFPPRWDATENTFRPPFFHRNATTEINGIIKDPGGDKPPFMSGGVFITPSMTPHGVRSGGVQRMFLSDKDPAPSRSSESSMWFQFESALPLELSPWGRENAPRIEEWTSMWGAYRTHFDPSRP